MDQIKAMLSASKERDAFRIAYFHKASLEEGFAELALAAQSWPKEISDVFNS